MLWHESHFFYFFISPLEKEIIVKSLKNEGISAPL